MLNLRVIFYFLCAFLYTIKAQINKPTTLYEFSIDSLISLNNQPFDSLNIFNKIEKDIYLKCDNDTCFINLIHKKIYYLLITKKKPFTILNYTRIRNILIKNNALNYYYYNCSLLSYINKNYHLSIQYLDSMNINLTKNISLKRNTLYALNYNEIFKYDEAKNYLYKNIHIMEDTIKSIHFKKYVDSIYDGISLKSIKKARILSYLIPGSGYLYLDEPSDFFVTFTLIGLSSSFIVYNILHKCFLTTSTVGLFLLKTSYFSGLNGLENSYSKYLMKYKIINSSISNKLLSYEY